MGSMNLVFYQFRMTNQLANFSLSFCFRSTHLIILFALLTGWISFCVHPSWRWGPISSIIGYSCRTSASISWLVNRAAATHIGIDRPLAPGRRSWWFSDYFVFKPRGSGCRLLMGASFYMTSAFSAASRLEVINIILVMVYISVLFMFSTVSVLLYYRWY